MSKGTKYEQQVSLPQFWGNKGSMKAEATVEMTRDIESPVCMRELKLCPSAVGEFLMVS